MSVEENNSRVEDEGLKFEGRSQQEMAYYTVLGVSPSASMAQIRRAYRELSKLYHPDTTTLPEAIAIAKFQQLKDAYNTLSNPDQRQAYDRTFRYNDSQIPLPTFPPLHQPSTQRNYTSSAYLDARDRPLSPGEIFALFIMGLSLIACLVLAIVVGILRGDTLSNTSMVKSSPTPVAPTLRELQNPTIPPRPS